jgi:hypothetical protein
VNSSSDTSAFRLISTDDLLLNRYSPDLILLLDIGDLGLHLRLVFLGGLGLIGEMGGTIAPR